MAQHNRACVSLRSPALGQGKNVVILALSDHVLELSTRVVVFISSATINGLG